MRIPRSTYRLQFTPSFGFGQARQLLPYLQHLGISDIYASPVFKARRGSTHGYDVIDPNQINAELGTYEEFRELLAAVHERSMGWVQDIVPNHMAFDSSNSMLMDVLEYGSVSPYRNFFDIEWDHPYENLKGRVLVPFLGKFYGDCLEAGEIKFGYDKDGFHVTYYDLRLPVRIESYPEILSSAVQQLKELLAPEHPAFLRLQGILSTLRNLPVVEHPEERIEQSRFAKSIIREVFDTDATVRSVIEATVAKCNGQPGKPDSFNQLDGLLSDQWYRLSFWKVATEEINYRRFFNINQLISVRVEDANVFKKNHTLILNLVHEGLITGLRVDHVDGLLDPQQYLSRLREAAPDVYLVVEKILEPDEELSHSWPVQGTTGYDVLNCINGLFCDRKNDKRLEKVYVKFTGPKSPFHLLVEDTKRLIMGRHMAGDIDRLALMFKGITTRDRHARDITLYGLRRALVEILALFPVYRTYVREDHLTEADRLLMAETARKAGETNPAMLLEINYIKRFLLLDFPEYVTPEERGRWIEFVMKFQQLSGPLMAKGFEDTALYRYNKLISLNEVGGSPQRFGMSPLEYHHFFKKKMTEWPHGMNATATHDTKRGEDSRARINVLSELPDEWEKRVRSWRAMNHRYKLMDGSREIPDLNDEYYLYQTLLGAFPNDERDVASFQDRIQEFSIKAVREAKVHTAWLKPDETYESGFRQFIASILEQSTENQFLADFVPFQKRIAHYGAVNSLSQLLLKLTSPGVPDTYQGDELWDFHLVDPDNRRSVDFPLRQEYLDIIRNTPQEGIGSFVEQLFRHPGNGMVKQFVLSRVLQVRNKHPQLFERGSYLPLSIKGNHRNHLLAYARHDGDTWSITIAPRRVARLVKSFELPVGEDVWRDTAVAFPTEMPDAWYSPLSGETFQFRNEIPLALVCRSIPLGFLIHE